MSFTEHCSNITIIIIIINIIIIIIITIIISHKASLCCGTDDKDNYGGQVQNV